MRGGFLPQTKTNTITNQTDDRTPDEKVEEPGWKIAVRMAQEKQATDIKVLDLTGVTTFTDYFVICTGSNIRQNQAITDGIGLELKKRGELPGSVEGYDQGEWILSDFGDFLVHVFTGKSREYYSLERLWREANDIDISAL
jgi:ribosome-associated protein